MASDNLQLMESIKPGELTSWDKIIKEYQRPIYYFIVRIVREETEAAELTQQVFVQAYNKAHQLKQEVQFTPWLYKIALNLCRNHLRVRQRHSWVEIDEASSVDKRSALEGLLDEERKARLQQAVEGLPGKQKLTVIFRVYQGLSYPEIAQILKCSTETIKANFHHAVVKLKGIMLSEEG